jgi:hypothetical protein
MKTTVAKGLSHKKEIIEFFKNNPNPKDDAVHQLADDLDINTDEMETEIYSILSSFLNEGKSKGAKMNVDPVEMKEGVKIELEHTNDPDLAEKIARDHLAEDKKYYTKLKTIEKAVNRDKVEYVINKKQALEIASEAEKSRGNKMKIEKFKAIVDKALAIDKGGAGSGRKGHTTQKPQNVKPGGTTHQIVEGAGLSSGKHVKLTGRKHPTDKGKVEIEHENGKKEYFPKNYLRDKRITTTTIIPR